MDTSVMTLDDLQAARGRSVYDTDGEKIGEVDEVFVDDDTGTPEWLGIGTGFLRTKRVLVPLEGATIEADRVVVAYAKDRVKDSPDVDDDSISEETERELYAYYGLAESMPRRADVSPGGGAYDTGVEPARIDSPGDTAEGPASVTRAEEELRVGTREVAAGQVRLRKWVETEPVQQDVTLRRETAHVTREPLDEPVAHGELGAEEIEVELRAEEPVVEKRVVAKERIGLERDAVTETQTVTDEVRKERVDVDGDTGAR